MPAPGDHTRSLSPDQRRIVEAPPSTGHHLLIAGPGSGKTRTIVARIAWLIDSGHCSADQVMATTFTLRAADELRERLSERGHHGILAGTFHHLCARLLDKHADGKAARKPARIFDQPSQLDAIAQAANDLGYALNPSGVFSARDVKQAISRRKRAGLEPGQPVANGQSNAFTDAIGEIDEAYCRLLHDRDAFDYDDLLLEGIKLLAVEESAQAIHRRYTYLFVDEFQDVSAEQYELIRRLCPPGRTNGDDTPRRVTVVADPYQSIFEWRDAKPAEMIARFRRDYRPAQHRMGENYRSTDAIVRSAARLLADPEATQFPSRGDAGLVPACIASSDDHDELRALPKLIEKAVATGRYDLGDIAILYRTHRRGDDAERALLQREIPFRRIQRDRFFEQEDAQEALRLLDLVKSLNDPYFVPALNWPRVVVDELTMIQLRRLAADRGLTIAEMATKPHELAGDVSPLSRVAITSFVQELTEYLTPLADAPIDQIVERMLPMLDRRRSPIPLGERETLRGALHFIGKPLSAAAERLCAAIDDARPLAIRYGTSVDAAAGATILEHVMRRYLDLDVDFAPAGSPAVPGAFVVALGDNAASPADGQADIALVARTGRSIAYGIALQAWRLGQLLLMTYEDLHLARFSVFDLETGSLHANWTELLEVAAVGVEGGALDGRAYSSLVRPSGPKAITWSAEEVHGIRWHDVAEAPLPRRVLADLTAALADDIVVGHNLDDFDGRVLNRILVKEGFPRLANPTLDTCRLARRLLPGLNHSLDSLGTHFGLTFERPAHRALPDARNTAQLLIHLLQLERAERELDALCEALPLVAIGNLASGLPLKDETAQLTYAGGRAAGLGQGSKLLARCRELVPVGSDFEAALERLPARCAFPPEERERWARFADNWRQVTAQFVKTSDDPGIAEFLRTVALSTELDADGDGRPRVELMTLHSAKGKEWPVIFILGVEEGTLPLLNFHGDCNFDEERRLLYVGMTRAMERLYLLWTARRNGQRQRLSRFLTDLPPDCLAHFPR